MLKRLISAFLTAAVALSAIPAELVFAEDAGTTEISNQYIKVVVNNQNGGYVIQTLDGDILKKSDDNAYLTHRGENYDTSFTSFLVGSEEYVFGEQYGLFGTKSTDVVTEKDPDGGYIKSRWSVGDFETEQVISLVNNSASEQLGTAMITYTVKNHSSSAKSVKSRILIDTQLGENDFGYYEVPEMKLGQGFSYFESEKTWDSSVDPTITMPSDYFVRDNPYSSNIVGYGVNSVFTEQKPYKMTFAHWANIAATVFDYTPDETLNFTNQLNPKKTADSAAALYYDLGTIAPEGEKSFSTYYGVTANLKNKDNQIILNTTAPSKLEFTDDTRTAYQGSDGEDNVCRITVNLTNPQFAGCDYKKLAAVVYTIGFDSQRRTDLGTWITYDNTDPLPTEILDFKSGENRVTYFDYQFTPQKRAQLGSFIIKVFNMDETVNELGSYAEEYCLATSENHIILPGQDPALPAITLSALSPEIAYNQDIRYLTVTGQGMEFFRAELLDRILLSGDNGKSYEIPIENLLFEQGEHPESVSLMLEDYMEPGRYQLHFLWKSGTGNEALDGVPQDFTSGGMYVQISSDIKYYNASYGIVTVQRVENEKTRYQLVPYKNEQHFEAAKVAEEDLLLAVRGDLLADRSNPNFYRLYGKDKDININQILNFHGDDLTLEQKSDGTVEVLMDGKITTIGANTTVRNGTAAFRLKGGTEYIIPEYNQDGEMESPEDGALLSGQDFIELKWDNAFDVLTTVGGFLIDMKYGVLGKIQNEDKTTSNIISFGGNLDLSFMTPGGAAAMRQNTAAGAKWTTKGTELQYDDNDDGYSFGLSFDEDKGFTSQVAEKDIPPTNNEASRVEAGAAIHDVLFGGQNPGYLGINMEAHVALPQIVRFLPNKIEGDLSVNTIGNYEVGVDAAVETGNISMALSLVVKESPSGAPIPDKLYFTIGGFEPGINVDGMGVLWVTGGGGGLDQLYDTIYGKDGVPPLTILLHVDFDITKIMTGSADLELSLRSLKLSFSDISLKMLPTAKFIDDGEVAVGWYPNFNLNLSAGVDFLQLMQGRFTITAAAGKDTADFVQFVLNVAIRLPQYIPIVGGMELASAELGGGSQKVWGSVEMLSLIKVGFTYYWGGSIEFTHGNPSGSQDFSTLSIAEDEGEKRAKIRYNQMIEPVKVGEDPQTGEEQFAEIGKNLSYLAGSRAVPDFEERMEHAKNPGIRLMSLPNRSTEILTNSDRSAHIVSFGDACDYILSMSRSDGAELTAEELKNFLTVTRNGAAYALRYYNKPESGATDEQKREALKTANINVSNNTAYLAVPKSDAAGEMILEFSDGAAYDVCAIKVNPISALTSCESELQGNQLTVRWTGENISDTAKVIVSATDGDENNQVVLNETDLSAKAGTAVLTLPDRLSSGEYRISVTLSDEDLVYEGYDAGAVLVENSKAPKYAPRAVSVENCGDDKLKVNVDVQDEDFDGYLVEIYEDGKLADAGLYFERGEEIIVGGRYEVPCYENGKPTGETVTMGYTPGKSYTAKVRLCKLEKADGETIYHSTACKTSQGVTLRESQMPSITLSYDGKQGEIKASSNMPVRGEMYINGAVGDGEWIEFTELSLEQTWKSELADGDYTVEFYAQNEYGDHAIAKDVISVDTTAPVFLLASPTNGESFCGDQIHISAAADQDASYSFTINGETVLPKESTIFQNGMLSCTLPVQNAGQLAEVKLEITATDQAGNQTVKKLFLTNSKISEIQSVRIASDKEIINGRLELSENESAELSVLGITKSGEALDITKLHAVSMEVIGGASAKLDQNTVSAGLSGQTLIRASFDLGGGESLADGIVIATSDQALIYTALDDAITEGKKITNENYTEESWNRLQEAITGAEQIRQTEGASQGDLDRAATAISDAIAGLTTKRSSGGSLGGSRTAVYTVTFQTNGGSAVQSQSLQQGQKVEKPEDPTREGYLFDGWYTDKSLSVPYHFDESVSKTFTLYAKWKKQEQPAWNNPFEDVLENDWFYENVRHAVQNGWFSGITDTSFEPNTPITRGMTAAVLHRMQKEPVVSRKMPFTDVLQGSYYENAILWALQNGIVSGISETLFAPESEITREQFAAMIYRYAKYLGYDVSAGENTNLLSYEDADDISEYAVPAMQYATATGLIRGRTEQTLNPKDQTTRAEAAAILQRLTEEN